MRTTPATALLLAIAAASVVQAQDKGGSQTRPKEPLAAAFFDARKAASQFKAPILAFVLPDRAAKADKELSQATRAAEKKVGMLVTMMRRGAPAMTTARDVMLRQVQLLRGLQAPMRLDLPRATDSQLVFALTVPVFASEQDSKAKPGENVVLLSPQGERVAGWQLDLLDAKRFAAAVGEHVFAEASLAPRRANIAPAPKKLLDAQRKEVAKKGQGKIAPYFAFKMHEKLAPHLVALGPALVRREGGKLIAEPELWGVESARAPFGTKAKLEYADPCPGCGMGFTPPAMMTVLKLVGP